MALRLSCSSAIAGALLFTAATAVAAPSLQAGAARVNITPAANTIPPGGFVRDPLYVRAIVVQSGAGCAVIVGLDQGGFLSDAFAKAVAEASKATGCAPGNFVISATHTHAGGTNAVLGGLGNETGHPTEDEVAAAVVSAVKQAKSKLQPARIGYGVTTVNLNVNRDAFINGRWNQAPNPTGPSDKTLAVIEFLAADGEPIGVYMNYAMHPVNFYLGGLISADFAGAASRYIERRYDNKVVAVFSQGASGDQNPLLAFQRYKVSGVRAGTPQIADMKMGRPGNAPWEVTANMTNSNDTMSAGLKKPVTDPAAYKQSVAETGEIVEAEGAIIGESALDTLRLHTPELVDQASIFSGKKTLSCPGRDRLDKTARQGVMPPYKDGEPVLIDVGLLRLGDVNLVTVNGEVYSAIAQRLKAEVPASKTIVVTLANGRANSGYIYSNEAATHLTFQVIGSRLKPGCAEDAIVHAAVDLMHEADRR
jgi:neutral ceramidase